jgi:hypothetical protein
MPEARGYKLPLELLLAEVFRRGEERDAVADKEVQLAVGIHVLHPNPGRACGVGEVGFGAGLPLLDRGSRFDQQPERAEFGRLALALARAVLGQLHTAVAAPAQQVQVSVAIPVDDERIAVHAGNL